MNKMAIRAARAAANPSITGRFGPIVAPVTTNGATYVGRARRAPRMTATQRDSGGRRSDWSRSPYAPKGGWR